MQNIHFYMERFFVPLLLCFVFFLTIEFWKKTLKKNVQKCLSCLAYALSLSNSWRFYLSNISTYLRNSNQIAVFKAHFFRSIFLVVLIKGMLNLWVDFFHQSNTVTKRKRMTCDRMKIKTIIFLNNTSSCTSFAFQLYTYFFFSLKSFVLAPSSKILRHIYFK